MKVQIYFYIFIITKSTGMKICLTEAVVRKKTKFHSVIGPWFEMLQCLFRVK